jgi:hypothetical protein
MRGLFCDDNGLGVMLCRLSDKGIMSKYIVHLRQHFLQFRR